MIFTPIGATSATVNTGTSANASTDPEAMQNQFLTLLVAQLNNQDPMNPMDNAQMTSQIAQINTVTGIQTLNQSMQSMADQVGTMQQLQGISMIGRSVLADGDRMAIADGVGTGYFDLGGAATDVKVEIVTPGGVLVDTVALGAQDAGRGGFEWDTSKYNGVASDLRFRVVATTGQTAVEATPLMQSQVMATGAGSGTGALTLTLGNGSTIDYANVRGVL